MIQDTASNEGYEHVQACRLCGSPRLRKSGRKGTKGKLHPQVVRCSDCGVLFVNPMATPAKLEAFYSGYGTDHLEFENPKELKDYWSSRKADDVREIRESLPCEPLRFLDIGSADGRWVWLFGELGFEAYGIELSSSFCLYATRKMGCRNIIQKSAETADFADSFFSYINFWHVIEHLRDPKAVLMNVYR